MSPGMRWPGLRRAFRLGRAADVAGEVDEELRLHLDLAAEELMARGLPEADARREAERRFGDLRSTRRHLVAMDRRRVASERRADWWSALGQDLRYAVRGLRLKPGFTVAVVLTLGLGIGANATMFGIVDRLLLRPPAYLADAGRTHRVWFVNHTSEGLDRAGTHTSYRTFRDFAADTAHFDAVATFIDPSVAVGVGTDVQEMHILGVTGSYWRLFAMRPVVGRFFTETENQAPTGTTVAVLGYDYWRSAFGGRSDAVGRTLHVGQRDYTIIGVAPAGFMGTSMGNVVAILPITAALFEATGNPGLLNAYNFGWPEIVVHRRPGISLAAANAALTLDAQRSYAQHALESPGLPAASVSQPRALAASVLLDAGPRGSSQVKVALWLVGVAVIVLIIACANVGNLLLARAFGRRREIAVRLALGISRSRLLAQLLTESLLLALLGGAAGLAIAQWGGGVLRASLIPDVDWTSLLADPRILGFAGGVALAAGLLAGLAPAVYAGRSDVAPALKAGVREGTYHRSRTRTALLVVQGALSVVLLVGAGLFLRSFDKVRAVGLGYDADRLLWVSPVMRSVTLDPGPASQLRDRLAAAALRVPGVEASARAASVPMQGGWWVNLFVPGLDTAYTNHLGGGSTMLQPASPTYFTTMGTRLLRGRGFTAAEESGGPLVVVLGRSMAQALWKGADPIGRCVKIGTDTAPCSTVVGVAEDIVHSQFDGEPGMAYYVPATQWHPENGGLFVRTRGPADRYAEAVRTALEHEMPGDAYVNVRPLADLVGTRMRQWDLGATMFTIFGVLALVVAAIGLYSVIAYGVAQRTHELGVRLALGAESRDLVRLVLGEGLRLSAVALALGLAVALLAGRFVAPLLFETSPRDPSVLAAVAAVLLVTSVAASALPALRAARVDPNRALRDE